MSEQAQSKFELGPCDSAIILREDGTLEACMPELGQSDLPENVILTAALIMALQDQEILELLHRKFAESCLENDMEMVTGVNDD